MSRFTVEIACEGQPPRSTEVSHDQVTVGSGPGCDVQTWAGLGLPARWTLLRLGERGYRIEPHPDGVPEAAAIEPRSDCGFDAWIDVPPCRLKVVRMAEPSAPNAPAGQRPARDPSSGAGSSVMFGDRNLSWCDPEIHVLTNEGVSLRFRFPGEGETLVIGRQRKNTDVVIPSDPYVSARHLRVFTSGARPMVEDLKSRHGSLLNGERLEAATCLKHGDEIRLGTSVIRYICYRDKLDVLPEDTVRLADEELAKAATPESPPEPRADAPDEQVKPNDAADDTAAGQPGESPAAEATASASVDEADADTEPTEEPAEVPAVPVRKPRFWSFQRWGGIILIAGVVGIVLVLAWLVFFAPWSPLGGGAF